MGNPRYLNTMRAFTITDQLLIHLDQAVRAVLGPAGGTGRPNPADDHAEAPLPPQAQQTSMRLMRVNHAGEVAAQALYHGQALTAQRRDTRKQMEHAASEELDHLAWCAHRVHDLGGHVSVLSPLWYLGAFTLGALAGCAGDRWSLGFLAETERQVVQHLESHLQRLPLTDERSRAVVEQMRIDETEHARAALHAGGAQLPTPVKTLMRCASRIMTVTAYRV